MIAGVEVFFENFFLKTIKYSISRGGGSHQDLNVGEGGGDFVLPPKVVLNGMALSVFGMIVRCL